MKAKIHLNDFMLVIYFISITGCCEQHPPSVMSAFADSIGNVNATLNAIVNPNDNPTSVRFDYGITSNYGSSVEVTQQITGSMGTVSHKITGLISGQTYHFRVTAKNEDGEAGSSDLTFKTTVKDGDGNYYKIVTIGTQTWMVENLKTTKYRNGDLIGTTTPATLDISGEITPKYQWPYAGKENYVNTYGRLYTWYVLSDKRNVCPTGWHVSTNDEWNTLINYSGGVSLAGMKLKEQGTGHWKTAGAINESGFTALPGGERTTDGYFCNIGTIGMWWTFSSRRTSYFSIVRYMEDYNYVVKKWYYINTYGLSVRCVRD